MEGHSVKGTAERDLLAATQAMLALVQ